MNTDPIADMLTRIRNAASARRTSVKLPHSKIKEAIAKILKDNGFVSDYSVDTSGPFKQIVVSLAEPETANFNTIDRISKPGRRIYAGATEIPSVLGGRGIVIVSTSGGLMTGKDAKKRGLGGELICKVW
jgi:small subunit ribosomal protein S8